MSTRAVLVQSLCQIGLHRWCLKQCLSYRYIFQMMCLTRAGQKPCCLNFRLNQLEAAIQEDRLNQPVQVLMAAIGKDRLDQATPVLFPEDDTDLIMLHRTTTGTGTSSGKQKQEDTNKIGDQPIQEAGQGTKIIRAPAIRRTVGGRLDQPTIHRGRV